MKTRKIFKGIIVLTIFALIAGMAYAATLSAASTPTTSLTPTNMVLDYDLTHVDSNLKPGDAGVLVVVIKNVGSQAAENVQLYIPETSDIPVNKRWDMGRIDPLTSKSVSTTLSISKNAYIGLHTIPVRISFDGYDPDGKRENNQLSSYELPIRVYGNANFQISVEAGTFYKDVNNKLVIAGVTQDGARDVFATLTPQSTGAASQTASTLSAGASICASIIGSAKTYLGNIGKGESFKLEYAIQPTAVGVCSFNLLLEYSDVSGNSLKETQLLGIDVKRYDVDFKITDVEYDNASPGASSNITITFNNVGSADANDVTAVLDLSTPFTSIGSSERYIGKVKSHDTESVDFNVIVDSSADIKAYEIPLVIEYYDLGGTKQTVQKSIGIQVDGKPEIKVVLEKADLFTAGNKGKITVNVVNKGFAEVKFLNMKILPTDNYDVVSSSEAYIGNLDSDATDSQEFEIQVKDKVAAGKIPLKFEVSYKEKNNNQDHTDPLNLELSVLSMEEYTSKQPTGSTTSILILVVGGIVGLIVAVLVLWFVYKLIVVFTGYLDRKLFKRKS